MVDPLYTVTSMDCEYCVILWHSQTSVSYITGIQPPLYTWMNGRFYSDSFNIVLTCAKVSHVRFLVESCDHEFQN